MSSMFFKSILIADIQKHTARSVSFKPGLNVVTSAENHVGKSSVIKSLYDTLGAEVMYDARWDKESKLSATTIDVDGDEYCIVRYRRRFAIFEGPKLVLLSDSVTNGLAPKLSEIFNFSVYLAEKGASKHVVQAPPAFTFMPYYIDQDKGWAELYGSFERMDQFAKPERAKSLFFHLGLYTKSRIESQARMDQLRDEVAELQQRENRLLITVQALSEELNNIIPAESSEELECHLVVPKEEIAKLVQKIGQARNGIQQLQTTLERHESQLDIIREFQSIKNLGTRENNVHVCPRCGYEFDKDLYELIRNNYNQSNEEYLRAQIELIVANIYIKLKQQEQIYIALLNQLRGQEKAYDESMDAYDNYLRYRGLKDTLQKYQIELGQNRIDQSVKEREIKDINKELQKLPDKKEVEENYAIHVRQNITTLGAWAREYNGKIKLLKALNAQGSLMPKIILSQYIGLFQTMNDMCSTVTRFPFVVDSPRGMESSVSSSKEILSMIANISSLPQVIVATVDYDSFGVEDYGKAHKIYFSEQFSVLNTETYNERKAEIEGLYHLMTSEGN